MAYRVACGTHRGGCSLPGVNTRMYAGSADGSSDGWVAGIPLNTAVRLVGLTGLVGSGDHREPA